MLELVDVFLKGFLGFYLFIFFDSCFPLCFELITILLYQVLILEVMAEMTMVWFCHVGDTTIPTMTPTYPAPYPSRDMDLILSKLSRTPLLQKHELTQSPILSYYCGK